MNTVQKILQVAAQCGMPMTPALQTFAQSLARSIDELATTASQWQKRAEGLAKQFQQLDAITKQKLQAHQQAQVEAKRPEENEDEELKKAYEERTTSNRGRICSFDESGQKKEG